VQAGRTGQARRAPPPAPRRTSPAAPVADADQRADRLVRRAQVAVHHARRPGRRRARRTTPAVARGPDRSARAPPAGRPRGARRRSGGRARRRAATPTERRPAATATRPPARARPGRRRRAGPAARGASPAHGPARRPRRQGRGLPVEKPYTRVQHLGPPR
jgi:hypothetical protein